MFYCTVHIQMISTKKPLFFFNASAVFTCTDICSSNFCLEDWFFVCKELTENEMGFVARECSGAEEMTSQQMSTQHE